MVKIRLVIAVCSSQKSGVSQQQLKITDRTKPRSSVNEKNELSNDADSHKVPEENTGKKPLRRNRELERLGVSIPVQKVGDDRRQSVLKKFDNNKSKVVQNSHAGTSPDETDADDSSTSEADTDNSSASEEDISDGEETEDIMSDSDNDEVIIVSEVEGKKSDRGGSESRVKKSASDRSKPHSLTGSASFSKREMHARSSALQTDKPVLSASSWWVNKVNVLETTMAEMKGKFAELLHQKVVVHDSVHYSVMLCNGINM